MVEQEKEYRSSIYSIMYITIKYTLHTHKGTHARTPSYVMDHDSVHSYMSHVCEHKRILFHVTSNHHVIHDL